MQEIPLGRQSDAHAVRARPLAQRCIHSLWVDGWMLRKISQEQIPGTCVNFMDLSCYLLLNDRKMIDLETARAVKLLPRQISLDDS